MTMPLDFILRENQIKLRGYQKEAVSLVHKNWNEGTKRSLLVLPTGGGKTVIAMQIITDWVAQGHSILFVVHREELITQTSAKLSEFGVRHGFIKAGYREDRTAPIQLASVQTMKRRKWWHQLPVSRVIEDEAHTTAFDSVGLKMRKEIFPDAGYVGLTATPYRSKRKETMADRFERAIVTVTPLELMDEGFLVKDDCFTLPEADLKGVHTKGGDWDEEELRVVCDTEELVGKLVEEWERLAPDRLTIAFGVNVVHCHSIADAFESAGVPAVPLTGDVSKAERKQIYERFRRREILVLVACNVLTEGFDVPEVSCVIMARPTKSPCVHFQQVGRGLRIAPWTDKKDCIVLDQAGNYRRFQSPQSLSRQSMGIYGLQDEQEANKELEAHVKLCASCGASNSANAKKCWSCGAEFGESEASQEDENAIQLKSQLEAWKPILDALNDPTKAKNLDPVHRKHVHDLIFSARIRGENRGWVAKQFKTLHPDCEHGSLLYLSERLGYKPGWARIQYDLMQSHSSSPNGINKTEVWYRVIQKMEGPSKQILKAKGSLHSLSASAPGRVGIATILVSDSVFIESLRGRENDVISGLKKATGNDYSVIFRVA